MSRDLFPQEMFIFSLNQWLEPKKCLQGLGIRILLNASACDELLKKDKLSLEDLKNMSRENTRVNIALLNHFIEGNGIEQMKILRDGLQDKIFEVE